MATGKCCKYVPEERFACVRAFNEPLLAQGDKNANIHR